MDPRRTSKVRRQCGDGGGVRVRRTSRRRVLEVERARAFASPAGWTSRSHHDAPVTQVKVQGEPFT